MTCALPRGIAARMLIYKIFRPAEWAALQRDGETKGAPVDLSDGFIHFSAAHQLAETAARHFGGEDDLILAAIEAEALGSALAWEPSRGGDFFPHLYGTLPSAAVAWHADLPMKAGRHVFPDAVIAEAHIDPTRGQFEIFKALDRTQPIEMLNLVRFRNQAEYTADHPLAGGGLSGAEAYAHYGRDSGPILDRVGGSILWRGQFETVLIGPAGERWDAVFIARYPTAGAFLEMVTDPDYREAVKHRQAAVLTSRLIRCAPAKGGDVFG